MILSTKDHEVGWLLDVYNDNDEVFQNYKLKTIQVLLIKGQKKYGPIMCTKGACLLLPISGISQLTQHHSHSLPSSTTLHHQYPALIRVERGDMFEIKNHNKEDIKVLMIKSWDDTERKES